MLTAVKLRALQTVWLICFQGDLILFDSFIDLLGKYNTTQSQHAIKWLTEFTNAERKRLCLSFNPTSNSGLSSEYSGRGRGWDGQVAKFHSPVNGPDENTLPPATGV